MVMQFNERDAGRLERTAGRALKLLGPVVSSEKSIGSSESRSSRRGPPDATDQARIAEKLLESWGGLAPVSLVGRNPTREADLLAAQLVRKARAAVDLLVENGPNTALSLEETVAIESVIRTRGRPALRVFGDEIEPIDDVRDPESAVWRTVVDAHENALVATASAVGAVVVKDNFSRVPEVVVGTVWLVRDDLVLTNRHVLFPEFGLRLARRLPNQRTQARMKSDVTVTLDFAHDNAAPRHIKYVVDEVVFVSEPYDPVDAALLRVRRVSGSAEIAPRPLTLIRKATEWERDFVYAVGHPGRMASVPDEVAAVFGDPDGRKRLSFGELMDADPQRPTDLVYDASTIGGFSGGPTTAVGSSEVIGLHYWGGNATSGNRAILASALWAHPISQKLG